MLPVYRGTYPALLLAVLISVSCTPVPSQVPQTPEISTAPVTLTILYTNDEHGWLAGEEDHGGAASMMHLWREEEGYREDGSFLILSGGDTWTGPAISSWFDGEPMIEIMNEMGYHAAAIGNHEFDNDIPGLKERINQATFPFLSSNIKYSDTGEQVDFALPYVIQAITGVNVGIIGLSTQSTPQTTMPTYVENLDFIDYDQALEDITPLVRKDGADIIVVLGHICSYELLQLAPKASALGISMIGGGHCHERFRQVIDNVALVEAGSNMRAYGRVDLTYHPDTQEVTDISVMVKSNNTDGADKDISTIVQSWQEKIDEELKVVIGYTEKGLAKGSDAMMNMVADAWLAAYPADASMSNPGGFRQDLDAGEITLADVVGMLPFDNYLIDVELTGSQLIESIKHGTRRPALGGLSTKGGYVFSNSTPVDPDGIYHVLVNNFMYAGGDGYQFNEFDPDAYETGIDWRQPVIDWIIDQGTSQENPLENYIDTEQR